MPAVGQEPRTAVPGARRWIGCSWDRDTAAGGNAHQALLRAEYDLIISSPAGGVRSRVTYHGDGVRVRNYSFQLAALEKAELPAVGRPEEGCNCAFAADHGSCFTGVKRADPHLRARFCMSPVGKPPPIGRKREAATQPVRCRLQLNY